MLLKRLLPEQAPWLLALMAVAQARMRLSPVVPQAPRPNIGACQASVIFWGVQLILGLCF